MFRDTLIPSFHFVYRMAGYCSNTVSMEALSYKLFPGRLPVLLFSKLNKMFFGYFDPENMLLDNENK